MSKKDNNINNVDEADVNINDTDVTSDTDKDADTVEAPVSYTHLDVYKRQNIFYMKGGLTAWIAVDS